MSPQPERKIRKKPRKMTDMLLRKKSDNADLKINRLAFVRTYSRKKMTDFKTAKDFKRFHGLHETSRLKSLLFFS
jgi:hypothetical protein